MTSKIEAHREKFRLDVKNTTETTFKIVDKVPIFSTKNGCFSEKGIIGNFEPAQDSYGPRHYTVEMEEGGQRRVSTSWLTLEPSLNQSKTLLNLATVGIY